MVIIDGYNCVFAGAALSRFEGGFSARWLCRLLEASATEALIVFDGRPKPGEPDENDFPTLTIVYSGRGITADDVISRRLAQRSDRRRVTVVSNDRQVAGDARRQGAKSVSCENFLRGLLKRLSGRNTGRRVEPAEKRAGLAAYGETEHWLREFGFQTATSSGGGAAGPVPGAGEPTNATRSRRHKEPSRLKVRGRKSREVSKSAAEAVLAGLDKKTLARLLGPADPP